MHIMDIQHHRHLRGHSGPINCVRFTHDGNYCMTAGEDKQLCLFNPHKNTPVPSTVVDVVDKRLSSTPAVECTDNDALLIKKYAGIHGYGVLALDISNDNNYFVSAGYDRSAFYWDVSTAQVIRKFQNTMSQGSGASAEAHSTNRINTVLLNGADNSLCFTGSYDKCLSVWDLRNRNGHRPVQTLTDFRDSVTKIAISDYEIIASCVDGSLYTFDLRAGRMHKDEVRIDAHNGMPAVLSPLVSCSLSDSKALALVNCLGNPARGTGGVLGVIDRGSGRLLRSFSGHTNSQHCTESSFLLDDTMVCTGSEDGDLLMFSLLEGGSEASAAAAPLARFGLHSAGLASLCIQPDSVGALASAASCNLVTAGSNGQASLWRLSKR
jgi:mitogen-activated protein kinase organizer 1